MNNKWINKNDKEATCPCWIWNTSQDVPIACNTVITFDDWTYWKPISLPNRPEELKPLTYRSGDKFLVNGEECMLCRIGAYEYTLICLDNGNRWFEPPIKSDLVRFTLDQIKAHLYKGNVITPL